MISFNAGEWRGLEGMGEEMLREMKPKADRLMWKAGTQFQAALKRKLTGTRSGRQYHKWSGIPGKDGPLYTASAPGEAPASPTGNLRNSMGFTKPKWAGWTISMEVGSGLGLDKKANDISKSYARRMEYGGSHTTPKTVPVKFTDGWRMVKAGTVITIRARPYMAPVSLEMEPVLQKLFEAGL